MKKSGVFFGIFSDSDKKSKMAVKIWFFNIFYRFFVYAPGIHVCLGETIKSLLSISLDSLKR